MSKQVGQAGPGPSVEIEFVEVRARANETPERMIKRFTRKVRTDGVLQEAYDRRFFVKPSTVRRSKRARAKFARLTTG